jgi:hypothetical protein
MRVGAKKTTLRAAKFFDVLDGGAVNLGAEGDIDNIETKGPSPRNSHLGSRPPLIGRDTEERPRDQIDVLLF